MFGNKICLFLTIYNPIATSCKIAEHCADIHYTETEEVPVKNCPDRYIKEPRQEPEHKTKCLFMKNDYIQKTHLTKKLGSSPGGSLF